MKQAIAYTREITLAESGETIHRSRQEERIKAFAAENGLEIVAWFTDEAKEDDLLNRPGIQALLASCRSCGVVVCERAWVLARSIAALKPFFRELDRRGMEFECAELMWDRVSQQCRRRSGSLPVVMPQGWRAGGKRRYRVAKPARLHFVHIVHSAMDREHSAAGSRPQ